MKSIMIRVFAFLLGVTILFFAQNRFSGALEWFSWSSDDFKVRTTTGVVNKAYWSGGSRSCQCTVLVLEHSSGFMRFNTKMGKSQREIINREGGDYSVSYHPLGNGENRPIDIIKLKTGSQIHKAEIYKGYGVALSGTIFSVFMLCIGIFLLFISAGVIKTDDQIRT